jgi:hypothetical protein
MPKGFRIQARRWMMERTANLRLPSHHSHRNHRSRRSRRSHRSHQSRHCRQNRRCHPGDSAVGASCLCGGVHSPRLLPLHHPGLAVLA